MQPVLANWRSKNRKLSHKDCLNEDVCSSSFPPLVHILMRLGMLHDRKAMAAPAEIFEGLCTHDFTGDARDVLYSTLTTCYEQAVRDGLAPWNALSMIVNWVATEIARLQAGTPL